MTTVLAINGSYRQGGVTDQAVAAAAQKLREAGVEVDTVLLRECEIGFCTNCRTCMQEPGHGPASCILEDSMDDLVRRIEEADGLILAAPTNVGSVTALFKRFMERLAVYAYWPWGQKAPSFRKADAPGKRALLISSCAAPAALGRLFFGSRRQLLKTARTIGAQPVGTLFFGLVAGQPGAGLTPAEVRRTRRLAGRMI